MRKIFKKVICGNCLVWKLKLERNVHDQLYTVPSLAKIGFVDYKSLWQSCNYLDKEWRELIIKSDNVCPKDVCIFMSEYFKKAGK